MTLQVHLHAMRDSDMCAGVCGAEKGGWVSLRIRGAQICNNTLIQGSIVKEQLPRDPAAPSFTFLKQKLSDAEQAFNLSFQASNPIRVIVPIGS